MQPSRFSNLQRGFTLIEALMSVALVGIFAAIVTPSFLTWLNHKKIEDAFTQVEGAVREAQAASIKKSQSCTLNLNTAAANPSITSTPSQCLPTGAKDLAKLNVRALANNNSGILIGTANLGIPATITFSYRGTFSIPGGTGVIVVYPANGGSRRRCLAIASGIGLIRTGLYEGTTPNNPTDTGNCKTTVP